MPTVSLIRHPLGKDGRANLLSRQNEFFAYFFFFESSCYRRFIMQFIAFWRARPITIQMRRRSSQ
ncbi:hypothetical protein CHELA40_14914 [Chelatococcus asaccharovorans]|nr:hypothetical protein CHELA17_60708 [Chelatococcus asaccharovorans]CAH1680729.1 hypothetical protein CHELA40_14914 [Chelatococcus asaccharovorans]